jgi:hypothetical protein
MTTQAPYTPETNISTRKMAKAGPGDQSTAGSLG